MVVKREASATPFELPSVVLRLTSIGLAKREEQIQQLTPVGSRGQLWGFRQSTSTASCASSTARDASRDGARLLTLLLKTNGSARIAWRFLTRRPLPPQSRTIQRANHSIC